MEFNEIESVLEGILFASGDAVPIKRIAAVLDISEQAVSESAGLMEEKYRTENRGIRLVQMSESLQLCSVSEHYDIIMKVMETRSPPRLSQAALEVLSIVAYFQPATRAYIDQVRGVDSSYTVGMLCDRGLIVPCGKLDVPGRPTIYETTDVFLRSMGISDLSQLPPLPELVRDEGHGALIEKINQMRDTSERENSAETRTLEQALSRMLEQTQQTEV